MIVRQRIARAILQTPRPVLDVLLKGRRPKYRGATLDPHIQLALRLAELSQLPKLYEIEPVQARLQGSGMTSATDLPQTPLFEVSERTIASVPVRVYAPSGARNVPALLYYHGGGYVIGALDGYDPGCRYLAKHTGCKVISVDYRLAPEHPFPAAHDDAWAVFDAIREAPQALGVDPKRIAVGGDSAGGCLATAVAIRALREGGTPPCFQLLIYPSVDALRDTDSFRDLIDEGYVLDRPLYEWFTKHYLPPGLTRETFEEDYRLSPMRAKSFAGLAPARIVTAGFDPLRDEAEDYAQRLQAAGVRVELRCHETMVHGAWNFAGVVADARRMVDEAVASLNAQFES